MSYNTTNIPANLLRNFSLNFSYGELNFAVSYHFFFVYNCLKEGLIFIQQDSDNINNCIANKESNPLDPCDF